MYNSPPFVRKTTSRLTRPNTSKLAQWNIITTEDKGDNKMDGYVNYEWPGNPFNFTPGSDPVKYIIRVGDLVIKEVKSYKKPRQNSGLVQMYWRLLAGTVSNKSFLQRQCLPSEQSLPRFHLCAVLLIKHLCVCIYSYISSVPLIAHTQT